MKSFRKIPLHKPKNLRKEKLFFETLRYGIYRFRETRALCQTERSISTSILI